MPKYEFKELAVLHHKDGVLVATITFSDRPNGGRMLSFNIQKEFRNDTGDMQRTSWLARRHLQSVRELLDEIEQRLLLEEEKARVR